LVREITNKKIIAVIPVYKDFIGFERCIQELLKQTLSLKKIIAVNNSTQPLNEHIYNFIKNSIDVELEFKKTETNLGSAGGFSIGMKKAIDDGAEWIWLHDEDDHPEQDCLEKLLSNGEGYIRAPIIKDPETNRVLNYFKRNKGWLGYLYPAPKNAKTVDAAGTAGLLIHRNVIEAVGIYDPEFFVGFEDWDFCLRAEKKGFKVNVVHDAIVYHPDHQSLRNKFIKEKVLKYLPPLFGYIRKGNVRDNYSVRNIIILTKRHMPSYILFLSLIFSVLSLPVMKIMNRQVDIMFTLKAYFKTRCAE